MEILNTSQLYWTVLEYILPHLSFREVQLPRELGALAPHHVLAPLELELQPVQLLGREGGPGPLGPVQVEALRQDDLPDGAFSVCEQEHNEQWDVDFLAVFVVEIWLYDMLLFWRGFWEKVAGGIGAQ